MHGHLVLEIEDIWMTTCTRRWLIEVCQNFTLCFGQSQFVWKMNDVLVLIQNCLCWPSHCSFSVNSHHFLFLKNHPFDTVLWLRSYKCKAPLPITLLVIRICKMLLELLLLWTIAGHLYQQMYGISDNIWIYFARYPPRDKLIESSNGLHHFS